MLITAEFGYKKKTGGSPTEVALLGDCRIDDALSFAKTGLI